MVWVVDCKGTFPLGLHFPFFYNEHMPHLSSEKLKDFVSLWWQLLDKRYRETITRKTKKPRQRQAGGWGLTPFLILVLELWQETVTRLRNWCYKEEPWRQLGSSLGPHRKEVTSPHSPAISFQLPRMPQICPYTEHFAQLFLLMLPRKKRRTFNLAYLKI